jgi:hypothetical protein
VGIRGRFADRCLSVFVIESALLIGFPSVSDLARCAGGRSGLGSWPRSRFRFTISTTVMTPIRDHNDAGRALQASVAQAEASDTASTKSAALACRDARPSHQHSLHHTAIL